MRLLSMLAKKIFKALSNVVSGEFDLGHIVTYKNSLKSNKIFSCLKFSLCQHLLGDQCGNKVCGLSGLYSFRQVTEVKLHQVRSGSGLVTLEA